MTNQKEGDYIIISFIHLDKYNDITREHDFGVVVLCESNHSTEHIREVCRYFAQQNCAYAASIGAFHKEWDIEFDTQCIALCDSVKDPDEYDRLFFTTISDSFNRAGIEAALFCCDHPTRNIAELIILYETTEQVEQIKAMDFGDIIIFDFRFPD